MKHDTKPKHVSKDAAAQPVVIHHEEETALARLLRQAIEKGPGFWLTILGGAALGIAALIALSAWLTRPTAGVDAWTELMIAAPSTASSPTDARYEGMPAQVRPLLRVADEHPNTPAARWALLRAASTLYSTALRDLPNQREVARPVLKQAIELYDRVVAGTGDDAAVAAQAAMGKARALEARGDLDEAITAYRDVATRWPNAYESEPALARAKELEAPEARTFYQDFYAGNFSTYTPAPGTPGVPAGMVPAPIPGLDPGGLPFGEPFIPPLPDQPGGLPEPRAGTELPENVFAPETPAAPPGTAEPRP
jgi:hypothetical protein